MKKIIRFLVRLLFVFAVIMLPFIACAIIEKSKIACIIVLITAIVLAIKETIR